MIREGNLVLDSYRLAQYAASVPCYICGEGNTFDAELCRRCFAPMGLAHQAETQKIGPRILGALGASGVGKTVYLGMLIDMLARQPGSLQLSARGAFSISLPQLTASSLVRGEFPAKTPNEPDRWNWVHCQVRSSKLKNVAELVMPDLAGEALAAEIEHPRSYHVIRSMLTKCAGVLVLIDAAKTRGGALDQDFFSMKLLSYLSELDRDPKQGWRHRPVGVVFSKADECEECFCDPAGYAQKHAPGLWQGCQERLKNVRFFAAGVAGACAFRQGREGRTRVPLRIEPRGVIEPFEWLVSQLKNP